MLLVSALSAVPIGAQETGKTAPRVHSPAEMNRQFADPALDVEAYVKRFEDESRDIYARRREIVAALDLKPGQAVADIGAGTGLFCWLFAGEVGASGRVYAVDIGPAFLKYIDEQARKRGVERIVKTVRGDADATNMPAGSIDVAFVCDAYHHFEHPERMLASIHRALRPGGRLFLVDFDKRPSSSEFVRAHARAPKEVYFREIEAAGFAAIAPARPVTLTENFFAAFERREVGPAPH
jgi:ubiquinone/menaquinone biosynthesis C-methylase UbiE